MLLGLSFFSVLCGESDEGIFLLSGTFFKKSAVICHAFHLTLFCGGEMRCCVSRENILCQIFRGKRESFRRKKGLKHAKNPPTSSRHSDMLEFPKKLPFPHAGQNLFFLYCTFCQKIVSFKWNPPPLSRPLSYRSNIFSLSDGIWWFENNDRFSLLF